MMFERRMTDSKGLAASWTGSRLGFAILRYYEMTVPHVLLLCIVVKHVRFLLECSFRTQEIHITSP